VGDVSPDRSRAKKQWVEGDTFAAGYPRCNAISCSTGQVPDDIETTVTAGQSSLNYDASSDQYNYVWKTDKSWAGSCRQFQVLLNDGIMHTANFQFKK
jgi:hypothetical protein